MKALARVLAICLVALAGLAACGNGNDAAQIKAVIEKADHEQEDAFAARDASIMQDTNTARNFVVMARTNEQFLAQGVAGIRLTKLEWGGISITSATTATANNWETWEQTDMDGNSSSAREREVYKLLKIGGSWKIDEIDYPDQGQTPTSAPTATPRSG